MHYICTFYTFSSWIFFFFLFLPLCLDAVFPYGVKHKTGSLCFPGTFWVKTTGEGFCTVHWGSFPQTIRKSSRRTTEGVCISLKISWILSLDTVSILFSILNSCNAIKSQFASQLKWLFFRNEKNNRCVQLADEFLMCLGIFFHAVNSNYISSCA